jgi:fumarylacetoacetase
MIDATHDPAARSWLEDANGHAEFPLQNLPLGVFSPPGGGRRGGIAIGDHILDIGGALEAGLLDGPAEAAEPALNRFLALGAPARERLRAEAFALLAETAPAAVEARARSLLHKAAECTLHLPAEIGDYTDFFAGIHHARNGGRLLRPDNPLMPNYKYVPVAYHGRASSVRPSGAPVHRPSGQRKLPDEAAPTFGPCRNLDFELEFGVWIGPGNEPAAPIPIASAAEHIGGFCLLNDWSARDIQAWEYQPLGPFLAKSFVTTVSPWIVTPEALAPFRIAQPPRPDGDPPPLPYLLDAHDQAAGALDLALDVLILTPAMRARGMAPHRIVASNTRHLYWTFAQMVAHHASNGCNLRPGDLFGSGTISAEEESGWGSLQELTRLGRQPLALPSGETRRFLEDGDEVILRARGLRPGAAPIGFGDCRGVVVG